MKQAEVKISSPDLYLGIDGGGSKCRAKIVSADRSISGIGMAGRANPVQGLDQTIKSIIESSEEALRDAGLGREYLGDVSAGIGLAGVNLPSLYQKVQDWQHPFKEMFLTTDLHVACLGAHAWQDGSVIITGTGSCGISIRNGNSKIYGAHGFPLGDQCSGAWIGLKGLSASLLAFDGLGPTTGLLNAIADELKVTPREFADHMSNKPPRDFACLAPLVFSFAEAGDNVARSIVEEGTDYINRLAHKILHENPGRLSILGGLRLKVIPWLDADIQDQLSEPLHSPEDGAIHFAKSETAKSQVSCA